MTYAPRVGILTYHFSENFGALMQAYALREWLRGQGIVADFINYHPDYVEGGGTLQNILSIGNLRRNAKIVFLKLSAVRRALSADSGQNDEIKKFQVQHLGISGPRLKTLAEVNSFLQSPEGKFDVLICGSDQIWAPSMQFGIDPVYYLAFPSGAQGARTIAYAPSFGRAELDEAFATEAQDYLSRIDALSVREASGSSIVRRLTNRTAVVVPDPTILMGEFSTLFQRMEGVVTEGHVFCYALRSAEGIREVANAAAAHFSREILSPYNPHRRWAEIGTTIKPSPEGWLAHLRNAAFVVTNSFHGTVFSLLLRKPFLTVGLPGRRAAMNERSKSLLYSVGLSHRFVDSDAITDVRAMIGTPIDWGPVSSRISEMQDAGRSYLLKELGI